MVLAKRLPKFSWPFYGLLRQLGSCNYMGCLFKSCYHRKETSVSHYVNCIQICNPSKWFVFTFELSSLISVFTSLCFDLFFHVDYIYIDLNSDLLQFIFLCFLFFFFPRDLDEVYSIGHLALVSNCTNFWSTGITWFRWSCWYPKPWSFPRAYFFTSNLKVQVELLFKKKDARRTVTSVLHSLSSKLMTPLISTFT